MADGTVPIYIVGIKRLFHKVLIYEYVDINTTHKKLIKVDLLVSINICETQGLIQSFTIFNHVQGFLYLSSANFATPICVKTFEEIREFFHLVGSYLISDVFEGSCFKFWLFIIFIILILHKNRPFPYKRLFFFYLCIYSFF